MRCTDSQTNVYWLPESTRADLLRFAVQTERVIEDQGLVREATSVNVSLCLLEKNSIRLLMHLLWVYVNNWINPAEVSGRAFILMK